MADVPASTQPRVAADATLAPVEKSGQNVPWHLPEAGRVKRIKSEKMTALSRGPMTDGKFDPGKKGSSTKGIKGLLADIAAMMLMTLMYSARVARYDLLKAINYLSKRITRWDAKCDKRLHRLMCYVYTSAEDNMMGWIGDDPSLITIHCFCDADFAGCPYTLRCQRPWRLRKIMPRNC